MFSFLLITSVLTLCNARPFMRGYSIGQMDPSKNQTKYKFTSAGMKGGDIDFLEYDVEFVDNYHSLDHEMSIEDIVCHENSMIVKTTTKDIEEWGSNFYVSGTNMWLCESTFHKNVKSVQRLGMEQSLYVYKFETQEAKIEELFKYSKINFEPSKRQKRTDKYDIEKSFFEEATGKKQKKNNNKQVILKNETTDQGRTGSVVDADIDVANPISGQYYYTGDIMRVQFTFNSDWDGYDLTKIILELNENSDGNVDKFDITSTFKSFDDVINYDLKIEGYSASKKYYLTIVLYYDTWLGENYVYEDIKYFSIDVEPEIVITSPEAGAIVQDTVEVTWELASYFDYKDMKVTLKADIPYQIDPDIASTYVEDPSIGKVTLTIPNDIESGSNYYIEIKYNLFLVAYLDVEYTRRFTIYNDDAYSLPLQLVSPSYDTQVDDGDKLKVAWVTTGDVTSDSLKITIYRDVFGFDPYYFKEKDISIKEGYIYVPITSKYPPGKNYYVYIEYDCHRSGFFGYEVCDSIESERFSISRGNEIIQFDDVTVDDLTVTIKYTMLSSISTGYFLIRQDYPSVAVFDPYITGSKVDVSSKEKGQQYTEVITLTEGSPFRCFVSLRTSCLIGDWLCSEENSKRFDIGKEYSDMDFNYDPATNSAEKEFPLFEFSCSNCSDTANLNPVKIAFCKTCDSLPNSDITITSVCEDCFVKNTYKVSNLVFESDLIGVIQSRINLVGKTVFNAKLVNVFEGSINDEFVYKQALPSNTGISIGIGPLKIEIGLLFKLVFTAEYKFEGLAELTLGYHQEFNYTLTARYPSNCGNVYIDIDATEPIRTIDFGVSGNLTLGFGMGLEAGLSCSFVSTYVNFVPKLSSLIYGQTKVMPADKYSDYPHYGYVDTTFLLDLTLGAGFSLLGYSKEFTYEKNLKTKPDFLNFPLFELTSVGTVPPTQTILIDESFMNEIAGYDVVFYAFNKELADIIKNENYGTYDVRVSNILLDRHYPITKQGDYTLYDLTALTDVTTDSMTTIFDLIESQSTTLFNSNNPASMIMKEFIGTCQISNCDTCNSDYTSCGSCVSPYVAKGYQCVPSTTKVCGYEFPSCISCDSSVTTCLKCNDSAVLVGGNCVEKVCDEIFDNCNICNNDYSMCLVCDGTMKFDGNKCVEQTSSGSEVSESSDEEKCVEYADDYIPGEANNIYNGSGSLTAILALVVAVILLL